MVEQTITFNSPAIRKVPAEFMTIMTHIKQHFDSWVDVDHDDVEILRLSGLSNACYRVRIKTKDLRAKVQPKDLLYREFQNLLIDKDLEQMIFLSMSDQGYGPKLYHASPTHRLEEYLDARPLTIWEMRNPIMVEGYVNAIIQFNFNKDAIEKMSVKHPLDKNNVCIDVAIDKWGEDLKARLPLFREKLMRNPDLHQSKLDTVAAIESTYLYEGAQEHFKSLIPRNSEWPFVLSHNDAQENNILVMREDNEKLTLIDYEYGGWNVFAFDIANYLNEYMLDNNWSAGNGIRCYVSNYATAEEREHLCKLMLERYFTTQLRGDNFDTYWEAKREQILQEVEACLILNNFYWGVWALMMLADDDIEKDDVFNYDFAQCRVDMAKKNEEMILEKN